MQLETKVTVCADKRVVIDIVLLPFAVLHALVSPLSAAGSSLASGRIGAQKSWISR